MKILSRSLLALLLLTSALPSAQAAVTMVSGNIYDVGKYAYSKDENLYFGDYYIGKADGAMCWAAAASNVIQYWQDEYKSFANTPDTLPSGIVDSCYGSPDGTAYLQVYQTILDNWTLGSGASMNAIGWWMQGRWVTTPVNSPGNKYAPAGGSNLKNPGLESGAYFSNVFGDWRTLITQSKGGLPVYPNLTNASFYSAQAGSGVNPDSAAPGSAVQQALRDAFSKNGQAVALSLLPASGTGHAITCWGYEEDKDGKMTSLILADSDDSRYGTFMAELTMNEDGTMSIRSDRYLSWYHGSYAILDATYIATPETTLDGNTKVAHDKTAVATISSISGGAVTQSCNLVQDVERRQALVIGGGNYAGTETPSAIIFTADAALSVHDITGSAPALTIADGAMALLNGGLTVSNSNNGGVVVDSHLYIHGGDVSVIGNKAAHSGAGIYASDANGKGLFAKSYAEIKGAGDVTIADNAVTKYQYSTENGSKYTEQNKAVFGGGLAEEDSITISNSGKVHIDRNSVLGTAVFGGGAAAPFQAKLSGNTSVSFTDNKLDATGNLSEGGGLAAMFIDMSGNGSVDFSGNAVKVNNSSMYYHEQGDSDTYVVGAHADGGAVAVSYITPLMTNTGDYLAAKLNIDANGSVRFNNNSVDAQYSYDYTYEAYADAEGGALFLGSLAGTGTQASVSRNTGNVVFSNNTATAANTDWRESHARGGAVYVGENGVLKMNDNKADVVFENNSVSAATAAQGGAIYNAAGAQLSLSNNAGNVRFSGNSAKEGNDLYNAAGAVAELAWNGNLSVDNTGKTGAAIVNKGTLYMAADAGHTMDFKNAVLDSSEGTLVLGTDAAGSRTGSGALRFTDGTKTMSLAATESMSATLDKVTLNLGTITGGGMDATMMNHIAVAANTNVHISDLRMGADTSVSVGSNSITLSNVVIDLSEADYSIISAGTGTLYRFNLQNMINCELTLDNVSFDATGVAGFRFGDNVGAAMDFGSDVTFTGPADVTLLSAGTEPTLVTMMPGMVIFGDVVPEPSTATLTLSALAALCARRRRKR